MRVDDGSGCGLVEATLATPTVAGRVAWPPMPLGETGVVYMIGCGSRWWDDRDTVVRTLDDVEHQYPLMTVVEGRGPGADIMVGAWAKAARLRAVHWVPMRAHWDAYEPRQRWRAGHDRNHQMLTLLLHARDRGHGVMVVAFKTEIDERLFGDRPDEARGGTEDMVRRSLSAGVPVWHVPTYGTFNRLAA